MLTISRAFSFEAAHTLERQIEAEGSRRIHGHSYRVEVMVSGLIGMDGMIVDGALISRAFDSVRSELDHRRLNEIMELGAPTLENICVFIFNRVGRKIHGVSAVRVWRETVGDSCVYSVADYAA